MTILQLVRFNSQSNKEKEISTNLKLSSQAIMQCKWHPPEDPRYAINQLNFVSGLEQFSTWLVLKSCPSGRVEGGLVH